MTDERPDPLSVSCPWCHAAPREACSVPGLGRRTDCHNARRVAADRGATPTENRPTMTPPPNRPDTEL